LAKLRLQKMNLPGRTSIRRNK